MKHFMGHRKPSGEFTLRPLPPFRLDLTAWALRRRSPQPDRSLGWHDVSTRGRIGRTADRTSQRRAFDEGIVVGEDITILAR